MKKIFVFTLASVIGLSSCKKSNPTPNNNTNNSGTGSSKSLPDEYIIFNDGNITDTLKATGGGFIPMNTKSNKLTLSGGVNINNELKTSVNIVVLYPSDSINLGNFPLGTYGTSTSDNNFGFALYQPSQDIDKVKNGTLGLKIQYNPYSSSPSQPLVGYNDDQEAKNSFHKINKITKLNTIWNQAWNIKSAVYLFEGEFKIPVKEVSGAQTKIIQGKYRWKCYSSI